MLMENTHVLKFVGWNPATVYLVDIFSHKFVVNFVTFV